MQQNESEFKLKLQSWQIFSHEKKFFTKKDRKNEKILIFSEKKRQNDRFGSFGRFTEISAETFRPRSTEISAEISVSVVH